MHELQEQELNAELDRFYVKPARSTGSQGVCLAQGVDGLIDAARDIIEEVRRHVESWTRWEPPRA